ncbi:hypothetical protein AVP42_00899 [Agromyces sp. NDB4Y10]|jgi:uncharacterized protein (DUF433 family)|uniref:DUF433 domain-containing protein n=1 Tax=Agromyces sp. NDB4Y10 TaxID=1775951 RepID=UPI0007B24482|nr:DUF433 domain-containing protein [Agromyces sp. NDB4Y10]KZE94615.1 hypothetical protein AVP42_00899 [Agromyces sp. NDB4Y10]
MMATVGLREEYLVPLYSQTEAARIVGTSTSSLHRWVEGYHRAASHSWNAPLVTLARHGRGLTVPFVGLAEAFVLASFRAAGLPMQRIRPAVEALKRGMGVEHALASKQLVTDGAEILWRSGEGDPDKRLVVVRNNQAVFREVVEDYLRGINYEFGYTSSFALPQYEGVEVTVDPHINGGRPTIARRGVSVADVVGRVDAGEGVRDIAEDYGLASEEVWALVGGPPQR